MRIIEDGFGKVFVVALHGVLCLMERFISSLCLEFLCLLTCFCGVDHGQGVQR